MARNGAHGLKYSPEAVKKITDAIALGAYRSHAAGYAGIGLDALNDWEHKYPAFKQAMREAEARGAVGWLAKIEKCANEGDWRAVAWKLEHVHPEIYGRTVQDQRHTGKDGVEAIKVEHGGTLISKLAGLIAAAEADGYPGEAEPG